MLEFEQASLSDQGPVRQNNEDFLAQHSPASVELSASRGHLFVVADGVGGYRAGEIASSQASQALIKAYYASNAAKPERALREAFKQSNLHIYDLSQTNPDYRHMETTLSVLALVGQQAHIGHVGDSRVYRIRNGEIKQITVDHSEVGELVRMRLITAEEARHHPRRNVITRSLGGDLLIQVDFYVEPLQVGDSFVLCTDGLWEPVEDNEIAEIVQALPALPACQHLVKLALQRETADNLSVQVVKVQSLDTTAQNGTGAKDGLFKRALRVFGPTNSNP